MGMGTVRSADRAVNASFVKEGAFEIEYNGKLLAARAQLRPFFDPKSERTKG